MNSGKEEKNQSALLEARHVEKIFPLTNGFLGEKSVLTAVDDVSFSLREGECLGLVGESGCGKSTLGRMACGLLDPTKGSFVFLGKELPKASAKSFAKGRLQMIFQDPFSSLNPRMRVAASVAEPLLASGTPKKEAEKMAISMLAQVGLEGIGDRYPHEFSGGQRQRICIARSVITKPDCIVCDEPVSALDASVQAQILNLLCDLKELFAPAYLFISHDLRVVGFMCERVMVMYLGRIVEEGSKEALFAHPSHPYTKALLSAQPGSHEKIRLSGELPSPIHRPNGCFFHPRCPNALDICREVFPPWYDLGDDHRVRCHCVS